MELCQPLPSHPSETGLETLISMQNPFVGTGSVGIEAISRGVGTCHFIEMDKWVVDNVLGPNLETCNITNDCLVLAMKAEQYLEQACQAPQYATAFDFVRCPRSPFFLLLDIQFYYIYPSASFETSPSFYYLLSTNLSY